MRVTVSAVEPEITRRVGAASAAWNVPEPSITPVVSRGCTHVPWLAIVAYTEAICIGLTDSPWPYASVASVASDQSASGGTTPGVSPGNPVPVVRPKPNLDMYDDIVALPTCWATLAA